MKWMLPILAAIATAGCGGAFAAAQELGSPTNGITVSASGETKVKPNKLEIEVKTSVSAELTGDAVVKYRDALKRAKQAIENLKLDNLQVLDEGVNIASNAPAPNGGYQMATPVGVITQGGSTGPKPEIALSKSLRLTISGIDKLSEEEVIALVAKLLDAVKDAGLATISLNTNGETGPDGQPLASPLVIFTAEDVSAAHQKATEQAFHHAQEKAQQIAQLSGGMLGPASAVEETAALSANNDDSAAMGMLAAIYSGGTLTGNDVSVKSSMLAELPVRVSLRVRFSLQPNTTSISTGATK
ncbi:MAG TPA: SIMPL domain-containing protein [Pirellulales bacterium]|nr:SIMPL domain-containing protein [Pirellulales bacterium]